MNAYDELAGYRFSHGRDYDKRSVETFRARVLNLVDDLLNQVTQLQDDLAELRAHHPATGHDDVAVPVVPTTWLEAVAGEPDHTTVDRTDTIPASVRSTDELLTPAAPATAFAESETPRLLLVKPLVAHVPDPQEAEPVDRHEAATDHDADAPVAPVAPVPAAFPSPPVMAWLADLERPALDDVPPPPTLSLDDEPVAEGDVDDDEIAGSTAELLLAAAGNAVAAGEGTGHHWTDDADDHTGDGVAAVELDDVMAPIATLPSVGKPTPPTFRPLLTPAPEPAFAGTAGAPAPLLPLISLAPIDDELAARLTDGRTTPAGDAGPAPVPAPPTAAPAPPEPVLVASGRTRIERLPIVLDDGVPDDDGALPTPVRHWGGWMRP